MIFYFLFLLVGMITFLFSVYELGKDDMTFIRKNVSLDGLFTTAFLTMGVGILFARVFYVLFHFNSNYLNPLMFFLIFYYPGLSFPGGLLIGAIFLLFYARRKKMPLGHTVDYFGLALLSAMPFGYIANAFLEPFSTYKHVFLPVIVTALFTIGAGILLPRTHRHELKAGTLGASSILVVSFINFLTNVLNRTQAGELSITSTDIVSLVTFLTSLIFFIKQEYILAKVKK
ncbi:MAG: prolipoprotein diacylglyceryl transferase [Candidatus Levybacteria bacterium]|nr:prolipoprotein diacylglyceryl transferase [Candidatus Levybacteria bacterium]